MQIDVFADVVCPWCFIGKRRLDAVLASMEGEFEVHHHPFVLQPGTPAEGTDLHQMLRERYGQDPRVMFERVEAVAREAGIPLDLSRQPMTYQTTAAHTLLRHAGPKGTQQDLLDAFFRAYFLEGENISDVEVLTEAAAQHGFTRGEARGIVSDPDEIAATERQVEEASMRGVRGVPLFVFNRRLVLSGAQPESVFRDAIEKSRVEA